jgi:hypothetical protein
MLLNPAPFGSLIRQAIFSVAKPLFGVPVADLHHRAEGVPGARGKGRHMGPPFEASRGRFNAD